MTTFVISDTHFGHANIIKFEPKFRKFMNLQEMDNYMIKQWNSIVKPEDTVYHIGDVAIGSPVKYIKQLNGRKILIKGNHDNHVPLQEFIDAGFEDVCAMVKLQRKYILTHCPMHSDELMYYPGVKNIHGHIHSRLVLTNGNQMDMRYVNVSVEHTKFKPINIDSIDKYQESLNTPENINHVIQKVKEDRERNEKNAK
jgi:calcineurin-like phosphoesterase family protein